MEDLMNGIALRTELGVIFENAVSQLLQMPERKDSFENTFNDADGTDKDLGDPHFQPREFNFDVVLSAEGTTQLQIRFQQFFTLLKRQGTYQYFNAFLNKSVYIYYKKQTPKGGFYKNSENGVSIRFSLTFGETDPNLNLPNIYLVDHLDRVLTP